MKAPLKISQVIRINAATVLRNAMFNYYVDGIECFETFEKYHKRIRLYWFNNLSIENDLLLHECYELFDSYIKKALNNCRFIYISEKERNTDIPYNFSNFCMENGLPFVNIRDMQIFINSHFNIF